MVHAESFLVDAILTMCLLSRTFSRMFLFLMVALPLSQAMTQQVPLPRACSLSEFLSLFPQPLPPPHPHCFSLPLLFFLPVPLPCVFLSWHIMTSSCKCLNSLYSHQDISSTRHGIFIDLCPSCAKHSANIFKWMNHEFELPQHLSLLIVWPWANYLTF